MSADDEDRPTTLAGGAQRALRAARAKAAAAESPAAASPDTDGRADSAADTARADDAGATVDAASATTDAAQAETDTDTALTGAADNTATDGPVDGSSDSDTVTLAKSAPSDADTIALSEVDVAAAVRPSVPDDDTPPEAPRRRRDTTSAKRAPREQRRPPARPARRRMSRLTAITSTLAVLALVFAVVSAVVWWRADHDDDRDAALARDDVAVSARLAIATVNTSDYRKPANALTNWLEVSTGTLHGQFADSRASATKLLSQAKTLTSATVLDAAVTTLDTGKGSATVIASVNVKRKPVTGAATTTRNRFRATMKRVDGEWKLDDLKIVEAQLV